MQQAMWEHPHQRQRYDQYRNSRHDSANRIVDRTGRRGELYNSPDVAIKATASDAVGVTKVEFYDGATLLGTDTTSPYSFSMGDNVSQ